MLACCGDGSKLKLTVIFKHKNVPKINNKYKVIVLAQEKGWMNTQQMKVCIEKAWRAQLGGLGRRKCLLDYDVFEARMTDPVKESFRQENTDLQL